MSKWALITGSSRGLGEALAHRFWVAGWSLVLLARSESSLHQVTSDFKKTSSQEFIHLTCDLGVPSEVDEVVYSISNCLPNLDLLINNAAIHGPIGALLDSSMEDWQRVFQVNLFSPVALCRAVIPGMAKNGGGSIINLSGGGATGPRPNFAAYASAKTALVRFTETLAIELSSLGINVNCISPGAMKTALLEEVLFKGKNTSGSKEFELATKVFSDGGASMDRVADLALFLADIDRARFSGKLISAVWDRWEEWTNHLDELNSSDVYTLRRVVGKDRNYLWGDK